MITKEMIIEASQTSNPFPSGSDAYTVTKMVMSDVMPLIEKAGWQTDINFGEKAGFGNPDHRSINIRIQKTIETTAKDYDVSITIGVFHKDGHVIAFWNNNKKTDGQVGVMLTRWKALPDMKKLRSNTNKDPKKVVASLVKWIKGNL